MNVVNKLLNETYMCRVFEVIGEPSANVLPGFETVFV